MKDQTACFSSGPPLIGFGTTYLSFRWKTEAAIKENIRKLLGFFVCFQFNCPALLSQFTLISCLTISGLKGFLCPKYSEKMHILCSHPRILCCFHFAQQNCHDREAVIWFWYLDCTYQNSPFAFTVSLLMAPDI